ncbi:MULTISPECIES: hypothetical protein [unclassified Streptomyces]|jgi:hypothetical protein|uniref:hypothetical protein n=1 Tax=unclassified Streptomyces TaxID=2593676 RepID=UPI0038052BFC
MNTVFLAGGPTLVRAVVARVIEAGGLFDVVGQAADEPQLCAALGACTPPDLVLFERTLQSGSVAALAQTASLASETARTIVFGIAGRSSGSSGCCRTTWPSNAARSRRA